MTASTAGERLTFALEAAEHRGDKVPCAGRSEWLSEWAEDRAKAARECVSCAVLPLCDAAARDWRPTFGTFAGVDWTDPRKRPKRARAEEKSA